MRNQRVGLQESGVMAHDLDKLCVSSALGRQPLILTRGLFLVAADVTATQKQSKTLGRRFHQLYNIIEIIRCFLKRKVVVIIIQAKLF
jgi:hypothetical protein